MLRCDLYELFCKPGQQDMSTGEIVAVCLEGHQLLRLDLRIALQEGINARSVVEEIPDLRGELSIAVLTYYLIFMFIPS